MTGADIATLVIQALVALGAAGLVSLLTVRAQKRKLMAESGKTDAEADALLAEADQRRVTTQVELVAPYERIMDRMQEELNEANERVDYLESYIETLVEAMRAAGITVPRRPPRPQAHTNDNRNRRS